MLKKKYFMQLLLLLFVLLLGTFSSCYGYTWNEFLDYCEQTKDMGTYNDTNKIVKYIANNKTFVDTQVRRFINPNDYDNFIITNNPTCTWQVCFYNGTLNYTISGNNLTWTTKPNVRQIVQYTFNNTATDNGNQTLSNSSYAALRGIMQTPPQNNNFGNFIIQNKLTEIILLIGPETEYTTDNLPWLLAQVKVQSGMDDTGIGLYLNNEKVGNFITYGETYTNGNIYTYGVTSTTGLISGGTYNIRLYDTNNNLLDISEDFVLEWTETGFTSSGTITNQSGDVTGAIDLSGVENRIDFTNELLTQQTQAILSGDKHLRDSIISGDKQIVGALTNTNFSGDITMEDLPQVEIDDPSENFFSWLLTNVEDVILFSGDSTLVIPIYNTQHEIRSDVFKLDTEPLKTFISIGWWFVCGIPLLKWVRHTIETIRSGNIPQVDDKSDLLGNVL